LYYFTVGYFREKISFPQANRDFENRQIGGWVDVKYTAPRYHCKFSYYQVKSYFNIC